MLVLAGAVNFRAGQWPAASVFGGLYAVPGSTATITILFPWTMVIIVAGGYGYGHGCLG